MNQSKRYTAEEIREVAISIGDGVYEGVKASTLAEAELMLLQFAHTESQVAGLVETLEEIVRETVAFGVNDYASRCAALRIAKGALSKFRGEA